MTQIILNDEQVRSVRAATDTVEVRDRHGGLLGYVSPPPSDIEIAAATKRLKSDGPWYTTQQVLDHLDSLGAG
jgi:hypothetical protein